MRNTRKDEIGIYDERGMLLETLNSIPACGRLSITREIPGQKQDIPDNDRGRQPEKKEVLESLEKGTVWNRC